MRDPAKLMPLFEAERDATEAAWRAAPPEPAAAFADADRLLEHWVARVEAEDVRDTRPGLVRSYWRVRNKRAGLAAR
jgi:hypothetical protein